MIRRERIEPIRVYFVNSARFPADAGKSATSKEVNSEFASRTQLSLQQAANLHEQGRVITLQTQLRATRIQQYKFLRDQKQLRHLKFAKRTWPNIQLALNICENKEE